MVLTKRTMLCPSHPVKTVTRGYGHCAYAASLSEFGTPLHFSSCDGWVLQRDVARSRWADAMGPYPLFCCQDWSRLTADFQSVGSRLVSLSLVADPFGNYTHADLCRAFTHVNLFKRHFVIDLAAPLQITKHHRYYARRGLREVSVEWTDRPLQWLADWWGLYKHLIARHELRGIKAFSYRTFERQLQVPGALMLRARCGNQTVAAHLWYAHGPNAASHLMAVSPLGYQLFASYALYWEAITRAIEIFGAQTRWLNLGAGAGIDPSEDDGLSRFKRGWTPLTRPVFFCGRIFDEEGYAALVATKGNRPSGYFPAYREGEFT